MNNKSRKTLHLVAGIYLFYLAFQLLSGLGENGNKAVSLVGGIAFIIIGGVLFLNYFRGLKQGFQEDKNSEEDIEETSEEDATKVETIEEKDEDESCE